MINNLADLRTTATKLFIFATSKKHNHSSHVTFYSLNEKQQNASISPNFFILLLRASCRNQIFLGCVKLTRHIRGHFVGFAAVTNNNLDIHIDKNESQRIFPTQTSLYVLNIVASHQFKISWGSVMSAVRTLERLNTRTKGEFVLWVVLLP